MSDWQLVSAYAGGDEEAFASLVRKYFPTVYAAAMRQVSDPHLAEEIAQSVFILFSRKAAKLSPNVLLTGWFLRTTRFVALDALKQMNRRLKREQQSAELAMMSREEDSGWSRLAPLIDEALVALSAKEQACVIARFIEGRSFGEIGKQQGITDDTAQKRVSRSLEKMRVFFERHGVKVGLPAIMGLLTTDLARAVEPRLVENAVSTVHAVAEGQAAAANVVWLADHAGRTMAWRAAAKAGLSVAISILLLGVGGWLIRSQTGPAAPAFRVSDNRIDVLGRAWAVMAQRAAFLMTNFPQGRPGGGDPNQAAYDQANGFVRSETLRITTELSRFMQTPEQVAEFLTVELRENLGLNPRQQAELYAQLRDRLSQGPTFTDSLQALWNSKKAFAATLRQRLSPEQRRRFDQTYGADGIGLLAFVGLQIGQV